MTTTQDLTDLWRQRQALAAEFDDPANAGEDQAVTDARTDTMAELDRQIADARTGDLAGLAIQVRLLADIIRTGGRGGEDARFAVRIAERLEALA